MPVDEQWLKDKLEKAVRAVYVEDPQLVERGSSERSLMFRVGRYLAPVIDTRYPRLKVDVEYNRIADHLEGILIKKLVGLPEADRNGKRSVYPDLIIHDRRSSSARHNFVVAEAKKLPASQTAIAFDALKLEGYVKQLHYRQAASVTFRRDQPHFDWISRPSGIQLTGCDPASAGCGGKCRRLSCQAD